MKNMGDDILILFSVEERHKEMLHIAKQFGWQFLKYNDNTKLISFTKEVNRIDIWLTKMTIATIIDHPRLGRNQLFRRKMFSRTAVKKIFEKPRLHTKRGYRLRSENKRNPNGY